MFAKQRKHLRNARYILIVTLDLALVAAFAPRAAAAPARVNYRQYADSGIAALQGWYNSSNGLWNTTGWWNSANALGAVIDYSRLTGSSTYLGVISNTY